MKTNTSDPAKVAPVYDKDALTNGYAAGFKAQSRSISDPSSSR
jgi:hypothetical protein